MRASALTEVQIAALRAVVREFDRSNAVNVRVHGAPLSGGVAVACGKGEAFPCYRTAKALRSAEMIEARGIGGGVWEVRPTAAGRALLAFASV